MKRLSEMMKERQLLSFELFPPKTDKGMENLPGTIGKLCEFEPEYISCTYGAGGTNVGKKLDVCQMIKEAGTTQETHFTSIGNTREGIKEQLENYLKNGVDHMLALRGDLPFGWTGTGGDFKYATDLVAFVRKEFGDKFEIAVAGSPEGHISCRSLDADVAVLKQKQDNLDRAGITMPVDVGIMPILDQAATINMALSRNACVMPRALCELISKYWIFPNPFDKEPFDAAVDQKKADFKKAGIEYTIKQIDEYRALGINGIHLYALNKWKDVTDIINESGIKTMV